MDLATLEGCVAKVRRAEALLHLMADEWVAYLETNPYPCWVDDRAEPGWQSVYFDFSAPPPPLFSVIAGEIAHDLRSALEHIAWQGAVEYLGREPTDKEGRDIAFPLARKSADFRKAQVRRYVSKDTWALMERHQPYKRGHGNGPKSLRLLHWINRLDKHRAPHTAAAVAPRVFSTKHLWITHTSNAKLLIVKPRLVPGHRLKGRTEIVRLRFDPLGPDPQVRVQRTPPFSITFGDAPRPLRGIGIPETITEVHGIITEFATDLFQDLLP